MDPRDASASKNVEKPKTNENLMSPDAIIIWMKKKREREENKKEIKTCLKETRKKMKIQHKMCKSLKKNLMTLKKKKKVMKREDRESQGDWQTSALKTIPTAWRRCIYSLYMVQKDVYCNLYSQAVTHPSTNRSQPCLTSVIGRELVYSR